MYRVIRKSLWLCLAVAAPGVMAQTGSPASGDEARAIVSIYHVAPGKQVAFLKWMADRDAIDQAQGVPRAQWYAHLEGDSWDYVGIAPDLTEAQQKKVDDAAMAKGLTAGPKASVEFRQFINSHTDTISAGPMTASELYDKVK